MKRVSSIILVMALAAICISAYVTQAPAFEPAIQSYQALEANSLQAIAVQGTPTSQPADPNGIAFVQLKAVAQAVERISAKNLAIGYAAVDASTAGTVTVVAAPSDGNNAIWVLGLIGGAATSDGNIAVAISLQDANGAVATPALPIPTTGPASLTVIPISANAYVPWLKCTPGWSLKAVLTGSGFKGWVVYAVYKGQ